MSKNKKDWFIKTRESYLPSSLLGLVIYLTYVGYLIALVFVWVKYDKSLWGLVVYVIPLAVISAVVTQNIASKHSK